MLGGPALYRFHRLSKLVMNWVLHDAVYERKAKKAFKANTKEWRRKLGHWSSQSKSAAVTEYLYVGMKGLVTLIGFEKYEGLSEAQRRTLPVSIIVIGMRDL